MLRFFRRRDRALRELDEEEAYARVHGDRDGVKIVHLPPRRKRYRLEVTGEALRRRFEERIAERDPAAAPSPADDSGRGQVGDEPVVGEELPGLLEAEVRRRDQGV